MSELPRVIILDADSGFVDHDAAQHGIFTARAFDFSQNAPAASAAAAAAAAAAAGVPVKLGGLPGYLQYAAGMGEAGPRDGAPCAGAPCAGALGGSPIGAAGGHFTCGGGDA